MKAATRINQQEAPAARTRGTTRAARAADLEWYWTDGQLLFESSSFGAVLERQARFGQESVECAKCHGTGFTQTDGTCRACKGIGGKPKRLSFRGTAKRGQLLLSTARCGLCQGRTGHTDCARCHGTGAVEKAPVGLCSRAYDEVPSYAPNENDLTRYAQVSRWLMRIPPGAVRVLEAYYGLDGYRWGSTKWGRVMAVVPLTLTGGALLQRMVNPFALAPNALLANHVDQIDRIAETERRIVARQKIVEGTREAMRMYAQACTVWNETLDASRSRGRP
jgi:hypothetical protein